MKNDGYILFRVGWGVSPRPTEVFEYLFFLEINRV